MKNENNLQKMEALSVTTSTLDNTRYCASHTPESWITRLCRLSNDRFTFSTEFGEQAFPIEF
ncbi:MAG: hypothetical protein EAX81_08500 [Candidatus Thorarchaeota archaeon]|nr:hypothetical protein [Candidatus Thorarchaeota archaeon]